MPTNPPDLALGIQQISTGERPDDGQGDDLRLAFEKFNSNMRILASTSFEGLTESKTYYVNSGTGNDTNSGLTKDLPYKTIQKAITSTLNGLFTKRHLVSILLAPGVYTESVDVIGRSVGARSKVVDIHIAKDPNQTGEVQWAIDTSSQEYLICLAQQARVKLSDITFLSTGVQPSNTSCSYLKLSSQSFLSVDNLKFESLGSHTRVGNSHISISDSALSLGSYKVKGSVHTHIKALRSVISGYASGVKIEAVDPFIVNTLIESLIYSDVSLPTGSVTYVGTIQGRLFLSDLTSRAIIGDRPAGVTVGTHLRFDTSAPVDFGSAITAKAGLRVDGPAVFTVDSNFSGSIDISGNLEVTGQSNFLGNTSAVTKPASNNSSSVATTEFVQAVVQEKIVDALPISTPELFGIVKVNEQVANPVVYIKEKVDTLLSTKADLSSPSFVGSPKAPTKPTSDDSTNIATTKFVKSAIESTIFLPSGVVFPYAGDNVPEGYLECDGRLLQRSEYPALFAAIRTIHGNTSNTDFRLPNYRDRLLVGADLGIKPLGSIGGSYLKSIKESNLPSHKHTVNDTGHVHSVNDPGHVHGVNDPSHRHPLLIQNSDSSSTDTLLKANSGVAGDNDGPLSHQLNNGGGVPIVAPSFTGISILGGLSGVSLQQASSNITINNTGGGQDLDITPKYAAVQWIIKV